MYVAATRNIFQQCDALLTTPKALSIAKLAFVNCRISHEETAINFLSRLEQRANEARNLDIRISEKKFIWVLLRANFFPMGTDLL